MHRHLQQQKATLQQQDRNAIVPYNAVLVMRSWSKDQLTTIFVERINSADLVADSSLCFIGDGPLRGICISKSTDVPQLGRPDVAHEFVASLSREKNDFQYNTEKREKRTLKFWFFDGVDKVMQEKSAKEYFLSLIEPETFPRDYTTFVKKVLLLCTRYPLLSKLQVALQEQHEPDDFNEIDDESDPLKAEAEILSETDSDDEDGKNDEDQCIENFITVVTPSIHDYQHLPEVAVSDKTSVSFRVRTQANAHVALCSCYGDTQNGTHEIVLGAENNRKTKINNGANGPNIVQKITAGILDGDEMRPFWISWESGTLKVGRGSSPEEGGVIVTAPIKHPVNCLSVSTGYGADGEWQFVEILLPDKVRKKRKMARRKKIINGILLVAKKGKMLNCLEEAYPRAINITELLRLSHIKMSEITKAVLTMKDLQTSGLAMEVTKGLWMRTVKQKDDSSHEIRIIKDAMMDSGDTAAPTVAVITELYCEKQAFDVMMEDKVSYVMTSKRDKTGGETQVYTVGRIGDKIVVSNKLPRTFRLKDNTLMVENAVTQLLGTFNKVEHVLLVGVGGAVPNYSNYRKHVRLGDVVVSVPNKPTEPLFYHCEGIQIKTPSSSNSSEDPSLEYDYQTSTWSATGENANNILVQKHVVKVRDRLGPQAKRQFEQYIADGLRELSGPSQSQGGGYHDFRRPQPKTDKLFTTIDGQLVFVEHPKPPKGQEYMSRTGDKSEIFYTCVGSGKYLARNEVLRMDFSSKTSCACYTPDLSAVLNAILGSRVASYVLIRGAADYSDGLSNRRWQPHATLCAAAFAKVLITAM